MTKEEIITILKDNSEVILDYLDITHTAVEHEDFSDVADAILRLHVVSRSAKVKINEPFEVEETNEKYKVEIENFIDKNGLLDKKTVIVKVD